MEFCPYRGQSDVREYRPYIDTPIRLLDGLILYRHELGDVGRQLELLLRYRGVRASTDLRRPERLQ